MDSWQHYICCQNCFNRKLQVVCLVNGKKKKKQTKTKNQNHHFHGFYSLFIHLGCHFVFSKFKIRIKMKWNEWMFLFFVIKIFPVICQHVDDIYLDIYFFLVVVVYMSRYSFHPSIHPSTVFPGFYIIKMFITRFFFHIFFLPYILSVLSHSQLTTSQPPHHKMYHIHAW